MRPRRPSYGARAQTASAFSPERTPEQEAADLTAARVWAQTVFDAGFGWITGPVEYGGRGLPREYQRIYGSVAAADYKTPSMSVYGIGLGMVAPTILAHATDEVKEAYLRAMHTRGHRGLPAVQRAVVRIGPGFAADQGRPGRRRVDRQRPEGVDVGSPAVSTSGRSSAAPIRTCPSTGD
jgi:hypothetical protein